jgi:capsule polysaccharide modification protein KpsS
MFCFFKVLAAPIAVIFASLVAAGVALYVGYRQSKTAESQAKTALDKLRFDLFEKRYAIYAAAKEAIEIAFKRRDEDQMPDELQAILSKFEESRFFFPESIHSFLDQLRQDIEQFLKTNYVDRQFKERNVGNESVAIRGEILRREANLLTLQEGLYVTKQHLPQVFASDLAFPQLTG